ncbi:hypothetical protein BZA70DRAFT_40020 [Myxozyma melibiosi]|uniref:Histone chaperone RTT106 n=1 Tax=Myxozyma melibiosi TaxID=54550 RepID=A0ABR1FEC2_9ASCO
MADQSFLEALNRDASLKESINLYIAQHPDSSDLFSRIVSFFASSSASEDPASKKRKLEDTGSVQSTTPSSDPLLYIPAISVSSPQRKKLSLAFFQDRFILAASSPTPDLSPSKIIYSADIPGGISNFFVSETPGRATKTYTYIILPSSNPDAPTSFSEAVVFVTPETVAGFQGKAVPAIADTPAHIFLSSFLESKLHISPLDKRNETFYVDAHRGTKDGYLFFTPSGILFGFKKPVWFVPIDLIDSVSYSSITRVTFNLTIAVASSDDPSAGGVYEEVEFSMVDQENYSRIDEYVRNWRLNDQSMAEEKREKRMLKSQNADSENGFELIKAEQEWKAITGEEGDDELEQAPGMYDDEDDDDEEDENFEANSDDDDGGSPSASSDEESDNDNN